MTIYNFSAGPAVLPKAVLETAQDEMLNYRNSNMSVMELSHRSSLYDEIIKQAEALLRDLMNIPANYHVLFLQGGASLQFSMVPLNLAIGQKVHYVNTGSWAEKAIEAARLIDGIDVDVIASSEDKNFTYVPKVTREMVDPNAAYVHITTNETIGGISFHTLPDTGDVPLIADMSSNILANDYQVSDFGLIYAGAQKNIGPAGLTLVIIRDDLLNDAPVFSPMLDYRIQAENQSLYNTPPTYSVYIAKLVFEWLKDLGGVEAMLELNQQKAHYLYKAIDESGMFNSPVEPEDRSLMNVPFMTGNPDLDQQFIQAVEAAGFQNLKGHRSVGGMRASIYNAFPLEGVKALVEFMNDFEKQNGAK